MRLKLFVLIAFLYSVEIYSKDKGLELKEFEIQKPNYEITGGKWWSSNLFGNVHKKITKKAYELIDKKEYPDIYYFKDDIIDGSYDEEGHPDIKHNGGDVYSIWFSSKVIYENNYDRLNIEKDGLSVRRTIGVLLHYANMDFKTAYENLGVICHLTQDQATPVHAANIKHSFSDQFEMFYSEDFKIDLSGFNEQIPELNPWEYYQWTQDDTRKRVNNWIDPENKKPYWQQNKDAPPLGKDSTFGPYGSYGGGKDHFAKNVCEENYDGQENCKLVPKSPEIRKRQISVAVYATAMTLKSASKKLPPLISETNIQGTKLNFKVLENRCSDLKYKIYKNNEIIAESAINLNLQSFPFSREISVDLKTKGGFKIELIDCDENATIKYLFIE